MAFEALTQADLAPMLCSDPECKDMSHQLFVHSRCHVTRPVEAMYDKATGTVTITCSVDNRFIMRFLVAKGGENPMSEVTTDPKEEPEEGEEGEGEGEEAEEAPAAGGEAPASA